MSSCYEIQLQKLFFVLQSIDIRSFIERRKVQITKLEGHRFHLLSYIRWSSIVDFLIPQFARDVTFAPRCNKQPWRFKEDAKKSRILPMKGRSKREPS